MNPRVNIITEFVFMAGRERTYPFLRLLKRGRRAQGGDGCVAAVGEEGAPSGPFAGACTHKSSLLSTASSRPAYHPIATG